MLRTDDGLEYSVKVLIYDAGTNYENLKEFEKHAVLEIFDRLKIV